MIDGAAVVVSEQPEIMMAQALAFLISVRSASHRQT